MVFRAFSPVCSPGEAAPAAGRSAIVAPRHYSASQIALHWLIAALVALQFLFADRMEAAWSAWRSGGAGGATEGGTPHALIGLAILVLAALRLAIRLARGAPPVPKSHPAVLRWVASATHWLLYAFLFFMPLSGAAAWFGGVETAAFAHVVAKNILLTFVVLHTVGAFAELLLFGTGSFQRMLGTEPER